MSSPAPYRSQALAGSYFDRLANWSGARRPAFFFMHGTLDDDVCIDCEPGGRCGVNPVRQCGTVAATVGLLQLCNHSVGG